MISSGVTAADAAVKGPPLKGLGASGARTVTPDSSVEKPGDLGRRAHTHYRILVPAASQAYATPQAAIPSAGSPPYSGYYFETPASLACIYKLVAATSGCDPNKVVANSTGGAKAIALVDAYDEPTAKADLAAYSKQFGLPAANFTVVYASGSEPAYNSGWALEAALDIEMAHAMAPKAKIYLVEAASNSFADLDQAVDKAYALVRAAGGGEVSMSYGGSESSGNTSEETHFNKTENVVFFASTGDSPGTEYPSTSPHVVAVGGTNTSREQIKAATFGQFLEETAWAQTGGGPSSVFARPAFQSSVASRYGVNVRMVPDVSAVASDLTPVWVYEEGSWYSVYGTSAASPLVAGMVNNAGSFRASSTAQLTYMYSKLGTASFFDVNSGACGPYAGYIASGATASNKVLAYDLCTGLGSPRGKTGL